MEEPVENQDLDANAKLDILKFIHEHQQAEMGYRREREYRIFTWSSNILLALIGALLITKQPDTILWRQYGVWGNIVASAAVVFIFVYSAMWQVRNSKFRKGNAAVLSHIDRLFHSFDPGYFDPDGSAIYPEGWSGVWKRGPTLRDRLLGMNYVSATIVIGLLALAMIWVP
jgi:hypothetical protein